MKEFEPDVQLEREVINGLLTQKEFLTLFSDAGVNSDIFISKDSKYHQFIASHLVRFFRRRRRLMDPTDLLDEIQRRAQREDDGDTRVKYYKKVLKAVYRASVTPEVLPYRLDKLVDLFKNYQIIRESTELKRYYKCQFEYRKHDECKGCPVADACRGLQLSNKSFADRVIFMINTRFERILEVTGTTTADTDEVISSLPAVLEEYDEKERERLEAGDSFVFGIQTPWPTVTATLDGWQYGCLYGLCAAKKTGKTTALVGIAEAAIQAGKNVLFFHMEDRKDQMRRKFASMISGVISSDLNHARLEPEDKELMRSRVQEYLTARQAGKLGEIYTYVRGLRQIGIQDIENHIEVIRSRGIQIDLVLFDHLHIAKLPFIRGKTKSEKYVDFVETLKAYCQAYGFSCVFAGQLKTSGDRKNEVRWSDEVEDSVDGMFYLIDNNGKMKLKTKVARAFKPFEIPIEDHRDKVLLIEAEQALEEDDYDDDEPIVFPMKDYLPGADDDQKSTQS